MSITGVSINRYTPEGVVGTHDNLAIEEPLGLYLQNAERNFYTTSSCGVCGKASIEAIRVVSPYPPTTEDDIAADAATLYRLPDLLHQQQDIFNSTGGLHASALFTPVGDFITLQE